MGGPPPGAQQFRPVGALLMILGTIVTVVSMFLTWNHDFDFVDGPDGGLVAVETESWNGWDQIAVNLEQGRIYGTLMLVAFIVALVASLMVLIAALIVLVVRSAKNGIGMLALIGAIIGLVGTLGVLLGYLALGATDEATFAMWLYGFSFVPVLIGAIGVLSKKF